jgi:transcriptional regulator with XRE-family HTH domain
VNPYRAWRRVRNLTVAELAQLLGINGTTWSALEQGVPTKPYITVTTALRELIGEEADHLARDYLAWRDQRSAEIRRRLP